MFLEHLFYTEAMSNIFHLLSFELHYQGKKKADYREHNERSAGYTRFR